MDSWKCLLDMLVSSRDPFRSRRMFTLCVLAWGVSSPSHLMKLDQYSRDRHPFHGRPRDYLLVS